MDIKNCELLIKRMKKNINELSYISSMCMTMYEKMFYDNLIHQELYKMYVIKNYITNMKKVESISREVEDKTFTLEELSKFNGKNSNPAYIAVNDIVYDVTFEATWAAGKHFGLEAGNDVSKEYKECHEGQDILSKLKKIGVLQK